MARSVVKTVGLSELSAPVSFTPASYYFPSGSAANTPSVETWYWSVDDKFTYVYGRTYFTNAGSGNAGVRVEVAGGVALFGLDGKTTLNGDYVGMGAAYWTTSGGAMVQSVARVSGSGSNVYLAADSTGSTAALQGVIFQFTLLRV